MTAREALGRLNRQFPHATEFAVSPELHDAYEAEVVITILRLTPSSDVQLRSWPAETLSTLNGHIVAQRLPLLYRGKPLILVTPA